MSAQDKARYRVTLPGSSHSVVMQFSSDDDEAKKRYPGAVRVAAPGVGDVPTKARSARGTRGSKTQTKE